MFRSKKVVKVLDRVVITMDSAEQGHRVIVVDMEPGWTFHPQYGVFVVRDAGGNIIRHIQPQAGFTIQACYEYVEGANP